MTLSSVQQPSSYVDEARPPATLDSWWREWAGHGSAKKTGDYQVKILVSKSTFGDASVSHWVAVSQFQEVNIFILK